MKRKRLKLKKPRQRLRRPVQRDEPDLPTVLCVGRYELRRLEVPLKTRTFKKDVQAFAWRYDVPGQCALIVSQVHYYSGDPWYVGTLHGRGLQVSTTNHNEPQECARALSALLSATFETVDALRGSIE